MKTRKATLADAGLISALNDDVQRIHAEALPDLFKPPSLETFSIGTVAELLDTPDQYFLIGEEDGEPVGYIFAEVIRREESELRYPMTMMYIHHISVKPEIRGKGFGSQLIEAVASLAREQGIERLALDVWAFNRKARAAFAGCGFEEYNIRMWKRLES